MNRFYKVMIDQYGPDGKHSGESVLVEDYKNLKDAMKAADEYKLSPLSGVEIRMYDIDEINKTAVIAFGSSNDTGKVVYKDNPVKTTKEELINAVIEDYRNNAVELSECYLENIYVNMTKAEFIQAWAEIQSICNGDTVIRLDPDGKECTKLIPDDWGSEKVIGHAEDILIDIDNEKDSGGPIFARWIDDTKYLSLVYGGLDFDFPNKDEEYNEI